MLPRRGSFQLLDQIGPSLVGFDPTNQYATGYGCIVELEKNRRWRCWDWSVFWKSPGRLDIYGYSPLQIKKIELFQFHELSIGYNHWWIHQGWDLRCGSLLLRGCCEAGVVSSIHDATGRQHTDETSMDLSILNYTDTILYYAMLSYPIPIFVYLLKMPDILQHLRYM